MLHAVYRVFPCPVQGRYVPQKIPASQWLRSQREGQRLNAAAGRTCLRGLISRMVSVKNPAYPRPYCNACTIYVFEAVVDNTK